MLGWISLVSSVERDLFFILVVMEVGKLNGRNFFKRLKQVSEWWQLHKQQEEKKSGKKQSWECKESTTH